MRTTVTTYLRLPVNADEGFPQAFSMRFGERGYTVALEVSVIDEGVLAGGRPLVLPRPEAYLVVSVLREDPAPAAVILRRKVVPRHEYQAAELSLVFTEMVIDPRNLNGAGAFGSRVVGGVAARWAS
ncbi:hypothetical protein WEI85_35730 [Actinomycetes bacterium KLBMP 9797]